MEFGSGVMGEDYANHGRVGIGPVHQPAHLAGEVPHGAALRDGHVAPAGQGFAGQEEIAGAGTPILISLTAG